jgi:hypothetical protein
VRKFDNLLPSCADVKKSGGLNLLETYGPVQACNGTALPLPLPLHLPHLHCISSTRSVGAKHCAAGKQVPLFLKIYCTENHWYTLGYKIFPNTNLSY